MSIRNTFIVFLVSGFWHGANWTFIAWVFFRAESMHHAFQYLSGMFTFSLFSKPDVIPFQVLSMIAILIVAEWLQRSKQHALQFDGMPIPRYLRWGVYYLVIMLIFTFGNFKSAYEFIYFQF